MTTVQEIVDEIKTEVRDADEYEITIAGVRAYINAAARDASGQGWLLHLTDDESLQFASNTYEYAVPASFAFIRDLFYEDASISEIFDDIIPRHYWHIRIDVGATPTFIIHSSWTLPAPNKKMKVVGFKRPTIYAAVTETVDVGMEAFLRDRAISHAYGFLATVSPELENVRLGLRDRKFAESQLLLDRHHQDIKVIPAPRLVPGR